MRPVERSEGREGVKREVEEKRLGQKWGQKSGNWGFKYYKGD